MVLKRIAKNPTVFLKKLSQMYNNELGYSTILKYLPKDIQDKFLKFDEYPGEINYLLNIHYTLANHYNSQKFEDTQEVYQEYAIIIEKYMKEEFKNINPLTFIPTEWQALNEQIARGFVNEKSIVIDKKKPYLKSNIIPIIWPIQYDVSEMYRIFNKIGVTGWTGIKMPKIRN